MKTACKSLSDFPPDCHKSMTDFLLPQFLFPAKTDQIIKLLVFPSAPWSWKCSFWGNLQITCFSASISYQCGWTATEGAGPPSTGTFVPSGLFPCSSWHSSRVPAPGQPSPAWTHTPGHGHCKWVWYLLIDSFPPVSMKPCCLLSLLPLEVLRRFFNGMVAQE